MSLLENLTSRVRRKPENGHTAPPIVEVPALQHAETPVRAKLLKVLDDLGAEMNSGPNVVGMTVKAMIADDMNTVEELPDYALAEAANRLCGILHRKPVVSFGRFYQIAHIADLD